MTAAAWDHEALAPTEIVRGSNGEEYRVVEVIGRGGFSEVYRVDFRGKALALKVLRLRRADSKNARERLAREGRTLAKLRHPNVVAVHDFGVREDGTVWMVMDLLVGRTLWQLLRDAGRLPIAWALEITEGIALGLSAIHEYAIHRDLKPENVHIATDGRVILFDLGAGKIQQESLLTTDQYSTIGTITYMSPEQILRPSTIDARSDLFAVGALFYELLTRRHPFRRGDPEADGAMQIGARIISEAPPPIRLVAPWVPDDIAALVDRCLQKRPEDRPASAAMLGAMLRAAREAFVAKHPSLPITILADTLGPAEAQPDPLAPASKPPAGASPNPFVASTASEEAVLQFASTDQLRGMAGGPVSAPPAPPLASAIAVRPPGARAPLDEAHDRFLDRATPASVRAELLPMFERQGNSTTIRVLSSWSEEELDPAMRDAIRRVVLTIQARLKTTMRMVGQRTAPMPPPPVVVPVSREKLTTSFANATTLREVVVALDRLADAGDAQTIDIIHARLARETDPTLRRMMQLSILELRRKVGALPTRDELEWTLAAPVQAPVTLPIEATAKRRSAPGPAPAGSGRSVVLAVAIAAVVFVVAVVALARLGLIAFPAR